MYKSNNLSIEKLEKKEKGRKDEQCKTRNESSNTRAAR